MHYGRVCGNWTTEKTVGIGEIDYDDLVSFVDFFPHTDEMVRFQSQGLQNE